MIRKPLEIDEQTPWQELTIGGEVAEGGTARVIKTGEWRSDVPRWDADKCKHCLLCAPYCPDVSILVADGRLTGIEVSSVERWLPTAGFSSGYPLAAWLSIQGLATSHSSARIARGVPISVGSSAPALGR